MTEEQHNQHNQHNHTNGSHGIRSSSNSSTGSSRLSTIIDADEILVLRQGEIMERGRHEELLKLGGEYSEMWRKQQKSEAQEQ